MPSTKHQRWPGISSRLNQPKPTNEPNVPGATTDPGELSADQLKEYLENLRPEDFGKFNL